MKRVICILCLLLIFVSFTFASMYDEVSKFKGKQVEVQYLYYDKNVSGKLEDIIDYMKGIIGIVIINESGQRVIINMLSIASISEKK